MLWQVLRLLDDAGNEYDHPLAFRALPHLAILAIAGGAAYWAIAPIFVDPAHKDILLAVFGALLAFAGLIIGFVANLMLFTGKLESASILSLEELQAYVERLKGLLHSQALTLVSSSVLAVLCITTMIICSTSLLIISKAIIIAITLAYAVHAGLRSLILPLQIFELHTAWLNDLVEQKARDVRGLYSSNNDGSK
jgi:hypothetical protein